MNKLVNKNPVQKFKQGKKIVKALGGLPMVINNRGGVPATRTTIGGVPSVVSKTASRVGKGLLGRVGGFLGRVAGPIGAYFLASDIDERRKETANKINSGEYTINNGKLVKNESASGASIGSTISPTINRQTAINKLLKTGNYVLDKNGNLIKKSTNNISSDNSFGNAFNTARNSGQKEFIWNGRRFNTQKKGEEGFIWSNGKWINPNIKFVAPTPTDMTTQEAEELNRRAKPITVNPTTTQQNEFAQDKQTNYPSMSRSTAQELFDKIILRDEFKTPYNPNFNWKNAPKLSYYPKLNYYYAKKGIKLILRKKSNFRKVAQ